MTKINLSLWDQSQFTPNDRIEFNKRLYDGDGIWVTFVRGARTGTIAKLWPHNYHPTSNPKPSFPINTGSKNCALRSTWVGTARLDMVVRCMLDYGPERKNRFKEVHIWDFYLAWLPDYEGTYHFEYKKQSTPVKQICLKDRLGTELKLGDIVSYSHDNTLVVGKIEKFLPATIVVARFDMDEFSRAPKRKMVRQASDLMKLDNELMRRLTMAKLAN